MDIDDRASAFLCYFLRPRYVVLHSYLKTYHIYKALEWTTRGLLALRLNQARGKIIPRKTCALAVWCGGAVDKKLLALEKRAKLYI